MHAINRLLSFIGLHLIKNKFIITIPRDFSRTYNHNLAELKRSPGEFNIIRSLTYDPGIHPESHIDYECEFTANHLNRLNPKNILDIGSYRIFVIGMLSHFKVTTIDVRYRRPISSNENVITSDAKKLTIPDNSFDVVTSLCALEHFGLGRYGDDFDMDADKHALAEMVRVLKPGGHLIFTTTVTRAAPSILFNAHRIYSHQMLRKFCDGLICKEENYYSKNIGRLCSYDEVTAEPDRWDVYCGCWQKYV